MDIDECDGENEMDCDDNAVCSNLAGGYSCSCNPGYQDVDISEPSGTNCEDVDECENDVCVTNAECTNVPASYECTCSNAYEGEYLESTLIQCHDIDECLSVATNDCDPNNGQCDNTDGGYTCSCPNEPYIWDQR